MSKKVIITGVTGQDGSYMVDYLLGNTNHMIYGIERRVSNPNRENIEHVNNPRVEFITADVTDARSMDNLIERIKPDYFINFAANSFVGNSWDMPYNHIETNFLAVLHQLEGIRRHSPLCRYYQAGSSEQWGDVDYVPQDEKHPFKPRSPYAVAKCAAHHLVKVYRESYGLYALQGILFNHESPRRGSEFVTQKIVENAVRIADAQASGKPYEPMKLGNLDSKRDWSHATDFVEGIWKMLNQETYNKKIHSGFYGRGRITAPFATKEDIEWLSRHIKEYVLASGIAYSVRDFVNKAFYYAGLKGSWVGEGVNEKFISEGGAVLVEISPEFYRPAEVSLLLGDSSLAREELDWKPYYDLDRLVSEMVFSKQVKSK